MEDSDRQGRPPWSSAIEVELATEHRWTELARLFRADEVTRTCWCMWPRCTPHSFRPSLDHEHELRDLVGRGEAPGLIARLENDLVGWCAVGACSEFPQYHPRDPRDVDACAIPCVYVHKNVRGRGVLPRLVDAAVDYCIRRGGRVIYGPPEWWQPGSGSAKTAILAAFSAAGFEHCGPEARMPLLRRRIED